MVDIKKTIGSFGIIILILGIMMISAFANNSPKEIQEEQQQQGSKAVTATVYVQKPNFDVIRETKEKTFTIIKDANPSEYEGTVLKLKNNNLEDVHRAAINLQIQKIIVYEADKTIAHQLSEMGFSVELRE